MIPEAVAPAYQVACFGVTVGGFTGTSGYDVVMNRIVDFNYGDTVDVFMQAADGTRAGAGSFSFSIIEEADIIPPS